MTEFKKVVKERSMKERNKKTKCFSYSSGASSSLAENFFRGRTLSSKQVDQQIKLYFPEKDLITDHLITADSSLLENTSEHDIAITLVPIIKSPVVEGNICIGLEKILPLAKIGLTYKESSYNKPGEAVMEDILYKERTRTLTMTQWQDPVQGNWRKQGEETPHNILIAKGKHLVFNGSSVEEGALTGRMSQWNI